MNWPIYETSVFCKTKFHDCTHMKFSSVLLSDYKNVIVIPLFVHLYMEKILEL